MNLDKYRKELKSLQKLVDDFESVKYTCYRDEDANLIVKFENGSEIKLPVIPLRNYQIESQKALFIDKFRRLFLVGPRRSGKEVESWSFIIQGAIESPGTYLMLYPTGVRAKGVLWDGDMILEDGTNLKFLDMIPKFFVARIDNSDKKIFLTNGSVIWVLGSDVDPNKLRGTNPRGITRSEAAFSDPRVMHILMPVLVQNKGWMINQSTFNGANHFYKLWQAIKDDKDWYVRVNSIEDLKDDDGNRYITDEMIECDRRAGMPEFMIRQEYYSEVQLNEESMFFSQEIAFIYKNQKIQSGIFLRGEPVYTFWDLGSNDSTSVLYVQLDHNNNPVIIGHIEENNRNIDYFVNHARQFCARYGLMLHSHFVPHDGMNRHQTSGGDTYRPKTFVDIGQSLGEIFTAVKRPKRKLDAINLMRKMLFSTTFNAENTIRLIECMSNYGKEFDQKHGVYLDKPFPKWTTNSVDSYQTMTLALDARMVQNQAMDVVYTS